MIQLTTGMFCQAVMGALHLGQAERGVLKLKGAWAGSAVRAVVPVKRTSAA